MQLGNHVLPSHCSVKTCHSLAGIVGTLIGDYIAQRITHQTEVQSANDFGKAPPAFEYDVERTARLAVYGALVGTPVGHAWFQLLDAVSLRRLRKVPEAK